jgi:hypothetical protein
VVEAPSGDGRPPAEIGQTVAAEGSIKIEVGGARGYILLLLRVFSGEASRMVARASSLRRFNAGPDAPFSPLT